MRRPSPLGAVAKKKTYLDYLTADTSNNNSSVTHVNFSYECLLALEEISDVCYKSKMLSLKAVEIKPPF